MSNTYRNSGHERKENDFYETPEWCTEVLLQHLNLRALGKVWEPCNGDGAISSVLDKVLPTVSVKTDITDNKSVDFLKEEELPNFVSSIITNPPYGMLYGEVDKKAHEKCVDHALNLTKGVNGVVAMLLRNDFDSAGTRRRLFTRESPFSMKLTLTQRPKWIKNSKGSGQHNFSWFVWDWNDVGITPVIHYGSSKDI